MIGLLVATPLRAQVGHDPAQSPFHDLVSTQGLTLSFGRFAGNRTEAGVGAKPGAFIGVRFDTRLSGPMDFWASVGHIASSRLVVDPTDTVIKITGPVDMSLIAAELGLALNLTGAKTWHHVAPFLGIGLGVLTPSKSVTDPGGYSAATNFSFIPTAGARIFLGRRLAVRLDARDYYFRYEWPLSYFGGVTSNGDPIPPLLTGSSTRQWTHNFTLSAGLTYTFTF